MNYNNFFHGEEVGCVNYNEYIDKNNGDIPFIRTSDIINYQVDLFPDSMLIIL